MNYMDGISIDLSWYVHENFSIPGGLSQGLRSFARGPAKTKADFDRDLSQRVFWGKDAERVN